MHVSDHRYPSDAGLALNLEEERFFFLVSHKMFIYSLL